MSHHRDNEGCAWVFIMTILVVALVLAL